MDNKEKIRDRVRQHMQRALIVGATGSLVLGAGCQSDPPVVQNPPLRRPFQVHGDPSPASQTLLFHFGKVGLDAEGKAKIDELLATRLKGLKLQVVLVVGHADRIGSKALNQRISERRASVVKEYLVSKGIEEKQIYTEGKGSSYPITGDKCKGPKSKKVIICLQPDRRVDIEIVAHPE